MDIIPVIDLLDGHVVHARLGLRSSYRPIRSQLCESSQPLDIISALLDLHPFRQLYIADLNAIQKKGSHADLIRNIKNVHPHLDIWLDSGLSNAHDLDEWEGFGIHPILGSENLLDMDCYHDMKKNSRNDAILSMDFHPEGYRGPPELLIEAVEWPDKLIIMTLGRVGSTLGPNLEKLETFITKGNSRQTSLQVYAAGGIRGFQDISALNQMGATGALVATALHSGQITGEQLATLTAE